MTVLIHQSCPPIVFVQRGAAFYFPTVLVQAARRCASSRIFVISDIDPAAFLPPETRSRISWVDSSTLEGAVERFRREYVHLSVNRPWLEQLCFERWFMIREMCRRMGLSSIIHLDSDVLVESDVGQHLLARPGSDVMFSRRMGPHVAFFRNIRALDSLCEDIVNTYGSAEGIAELRRDYQAIRDRGEMGSISDMFFFQRLLLSQGDGYGDTFDVVDGAFFDHSMGMCEGYRFRMGTKEVRHRSNSAYCRKVDSDESVRVLALHFQGVTKIWMAWHADVKSISDAWRSTQLFCRGAISYAARSHRYLLRKWTVVWRKWNARPPL